MRYFAKNNFPIALVGQGITSLGQIFTLQSAVCNIFLLYFIVLRIKFCLVIADRWFHSSERFFIVNAINYTVVLGNSVGFIFTTFFVTDAARNNLDLLNVYK